MQHCGPFIAKRETPSLQSNSSAWFAITRMLCVTNSLENPGSCHLRRGPNWSTALKKSEQGARKSDFWSAIWSPSLGKENGLSFLFGVKNFSLSFRRFFACGLGYALRSSTAIHQVLHAKRLSMI